MKLLVDVGFKHQTPGTNRISLKNACRLRWSSIEPRAIIRYSSVAVVTWLLSIHLHLNWQALVRLRLTHLVDDSGDFRMESMRHVGHGRRRLTAEMRQVQQSEDDEIFSTHKLGPKARAASSAEAAEAGDIVVVI